MSKNIDTTMSPQQLEILHKLGTTMHVKEIGSAMGISDKTVEYHIMQIYEKTGCKSRAELVKYASDHNIVKKDEVFKPSQSGKVMKPVAPKSFFENNADLAGALLRAATISSKALETGTSVDVAAVNALCNCAQGYINVARLQMDAMLKLSSVDVPANLKELKGDQ